MKKTLSQIEKNVSASFGYVKKDMLMLNDAFSDLNDKVQHLSINHGVLLDEIAKLRKEIEQLKGAKGGSKKKVLGAKKADTQKKENKASEKKKIKKVVKETVTYE